MRRAVIRARTVDESSIPRDSASQVSRATLGLRDMLLRGVLRPGQRIAEIPLSEKLGVSRTPLRLAFERLEHEGLVKPLPHSGFTPNEFSIADIWDAIETRGILEGAAARLAAERLQNPAQLDSLRRINAEMDAMSTIDFESFTRYLDLNEAFHLGILELANNQSLRRALEHVCRVPFAAPSSRVLLPKTMPGSKEILPIAKEHHRGLLEAIENGEGARAESLGREHSRLTRRNLEEALADQSFLETVPGARLIKLRSVS